MLNPDHDLRDPLKGATILYSAYNVLEEAVKLAKTTNNTSFAAARPPVRVTVSNILPPGWIIAAKGSQVVRLIRARAA